MTDNSTDVRIEIHGAVAEVVMSRGPVNAISVDMYRELTEAFVSLSGRVDVHAMILRSDVRRAFSAGADIHETFEPTSANESAAEQRQRLARTCYEAILDAAVPTIALIHGYALGAGAVLAACCDIRVLADDAQIGLPEINAGRCGGGRHLMRLIPQGQARLLYFTGRPMDAQEAYRVGYGQRLAPKDTALDAARVLADEISQKSPLGLRLAKRSLNEAEDLGVREGYRTEQQFTIQLAEHPDATEAVRSTLEKRQANWSWPGDATRWA